MTLFIILSGMKVWQGIVGMIVCLLIGAILGFFIPIVGWILYFSWKNTKPGDAKMAGIGGTVGFILNLILLNMN